VAVLVYGMLEPARARRNLNDVIARRTHEL
jgi:hypothetical protein